MLKKKYLTMKASKENYFRLTGTKITGIN